MNQRGEGIYCAIPTSQVVDALASPNMSAFRPETLTDKTVDAFDSQSVHQIIVFEIDHDAIESDFE